MATKVKLHQWIKVTLCPILIIHTDNDVVIFVDPDDQENAEHEAAYGCENCDLPLTPETITQECKGYPE